jgi:hypothetical protein
MAGSPTRKERRARFDAWCAEPESLQDLLDYLVNGGTPTEFARTLDVPYVMLRDWAEAEPARSAAYARAREDGADARFYRIESLLDEEPAYHPITGVIDPGSVQLMKVRIDTLRWIASKLANRKYGDKLDINAKVEHDVVGDLRTFLQGGSRLPIAQRVIE